MIFSVMRVLLILSLLANVVLAAFLWNFPGNSLYRYAHPAIDSAQASTAPSGGLTTPDKRAGLSLAGGLKRNDPAAVRDQLRALGVSEDVIRGVLHALVYRRVHLLQEQIARTQQKNNAFWQTTPGTVSPDRMSKEQRLALHESVRSAARELDTLVGPDPEEQGAYRTNFLTPDKSTKVRDLERDYADLRSDLIADARELRTPPDPNQLVYLEQQKRADLAAVLTPAELADYDLRSSPTASRLRSQLQYQGFDATESEYKAIYAAQKAVDDQLNNTASVSGDRVQAYQDAEEQAQVQLRAELGEARYAEYVRSQDPDYRALESAAKRFALPDAAVAQTYLARDQALATSQIIANNANLTEDQRRQQLLELANQTKAQIQAALGPDASNAYLERNMSWLHVLQGGTPIVVGANGQVRPVTNKR